MEKTHPRYIGRRPKVVIMATFFLAVCILVSVPDRAWAAFTYSAFTLYHKISFVWFFLFLFCFLSFFRGHFLLLIDVAVFGGGVLAFCVCPRGPIIFYVFIL